jgi:DNA-binding transcriptional LysR family regulator
MELRHLRYFLAVADTLNFSRAAERLRVAQPALSRQIHDLEEQLGFKLFERSTTKVSLTEAGEFFRHQAGRLLMQLDLAVTGAQRIAQGITGDFRIGSGWGDAALFVAEAARELHERHPELSIDFVELRPHEQLPAIREHRVDVGFVSDSLMGPGKDTVARLIYTGDVKAVLPMAHPLAGQAMIRLRDLRDERWITMEEKEISGFKALLTQILRPARFTPKFGRSARSFQGMLAFVGTGEGVALIPELFLPAPPAGLRYVATDCPPFELFAVWPKNLAHPQLPAYLEILQEKIKAESRGSARPAPGPVPRAKAG